MPEILHKICINASKESVYRALTEQDGLEGWWTEDVRARPTLDDVNEFRFAQGQHVMRMRNASLDPFDRVVWRCVGGDEQWKGTQIQFILSTEEAHTVLRFAHREWTQASELFMHCSTKWAYFLMSLKSFVETGQGTPHPHDLYL